MAINCNNVRPECAVIDPDRRRDDVVAREIEVNVARRSCADPLEGQPAATQRSLSAQTLSASASSRASALGVAMAQSER